jgi:hypothetical protein
MMLGCCKQQHTAAAHTAAHTAALQQQLALSRYNSPGERPHDVGVLQAAAHQAAHTAARQQQRKQLLLCKELIKRHSCQRPHDVGVLQAAR